MSSEVEPSTVYTREFRLGAWLVRPSLNRIEHGDEVTQIEPKAMEVLVDLAERPGDVRSKNHLIRAVWKEAFVTDDVLTQAIKNLRSALGDDAKRPKYIETILKRGYRLIAPVTRDSTPGEIDSQQVGHYRILDKLGSGGMGVVYKAEDTNLKRIVALKFLPPEVADDPERMQRFGREAESLAALNHPGIVTIYAIEQEADQRFLVMEHVEGSTLAERIPETGLNQLELCDIAILLADALAEAHEKGVIHRDLKPANIIVSDHGRVKVLDFGLAKLRDATADTKLPTERLTGESRIPGTVPYMSPEQVEGQPIDHRSDLFSLGVILYEMATGQRPFKGDTSVSVMSAIVKEQPRPFPAVKEELPPHLRRIIRRCLEKDPKRRYQSARDVRSELEDLRGEAESGELRERPIPAPMFRRWKHWMIAGLLGIGLVAIGWWLLVERDRWTPLPPPTYIPFTTDGGWKEAPCLSPDGERVAYAWRREPTEHLDIYVKALGLGAEPLRLTDDPGEETSPAWSPDGRVIAFVRSSEGEYAIHLVSSMGGRERKLVDLMGYLPGYTSLSWSPDGDWIAVSERSAEEQPHRIVAISLDTGQRWNLTTPPAGIGGDLSPAFSPDGGMVAFFRRVQPDWGNNDVWVQSLGGGEARRLTFQEFLYCVGPAWTADSREVIFSASQGGVERSFRVRLEGGSPRPVEGLGSFSTLGSIRGNRMVYQEATPAHQDIWRVQAQRPPDTERIPERLIASSSFDSQPVFSPDGTRIAFQSFRSGTPSIWTAQHDGARSTQLTSVRTSPGTPAWSPDSRRIVFDALDSGSADLWVIEAEGGVARQLTFGPSEDATPSWSRDGRWIYFQSNRSGATQIWKIPADGGEAVQVTRGGGYYARESWDGGILFYTKSLGPTGLWRVPVEGGDEIEVLPEVIAEWFSWDVSRSGIYYVSRVDAEFTLHHLDLATGEVSELLRRKGIGSLESLSVSPDEAWVAYAEEPRGKAELVLVENFR